MIPALLTVLIFSAAAIVAARALVELICRQIDHDLHATRGRKLGSWN